MAERRRVVALVSDAVAPWHRGGKESYYEELARRLAMRVDLHIYTMHWWDGPAVIEKDGVSYHAICRRRDLYSKGRRSIRQAIVFALACLRLLGEDFDVIAADHMPYMQLYSLRLVAWLRRVRLVATWHECWGADYWRRYLGAFGRLGWMIESLSLRLPDGIICVSPETAEQVRELTMGRVPVEVATFGLDLERLSGIQPASDAPDIVSVGRLLPHKRLDLLVEALAVLHAQGNPVSAMIVGSGPQLPALRMRADALGLGDHISFRQNIAEQGELLSIVKGARVAVFPSEREGFGIAVLEALACGTWVVTTDAPANNARLLVRDGRDGTVCEPSAGAIAQAIAAALPGDDRSLTAVDHDRLRDYDWSAITQVVVGALQ
jgi:glycosyltransferase involved in cell wall biosynthesis